MLILPCEEMEYFERQPFPGGEIYLIHKNEFALAEEDTTVENFRRVTAYRLVADTELGAAVEMLDDQTHDNLVDLLLWH